MKIQKDLKFVDDKIVTTCCAFYSSWLEHYAMLKVLNKIVQ